MTEVRFYHLTRATLEKALPQMLEKTLERGQRAVVLLSSRDRAEALAEHLWAYNDRGFLPHGTHRDGHAAEQPVWLTDKDENPNGAEVLFQADGAASEKLDSYALVADLFDGGDADAVQAARERWTSVKAAGHAATYWQQDDRGRWSQKA
ncbi:MAG: DNA polymerase III subunit chi [Rhodovibrionaceae bacterium]|nr:DNA polymerase III subunit chi [Rhodovibrionaceae bacterium]